MSSVPVDQQTRDLISMSGLGRTLFVEAGAGSGKTRQLVERIVNLVLVGGVRLANIAAITFTEAAAAELQSRIRVTFEKRASEALASGDGALNERCLEALADADLAAISTLHGFASRLLSEFAVAADLPPRVRVLDEVSSQLAHEERWGRFLDRLYDDPEHEAMLVRAALLGVDLEPLYPGHTTLRDVAVEFNQNWDRIDSLVDGALPPLSEIDFGAVDAAIAGVVALPDRCTDPDDKFLAHLLDRVIPEMESIRSVADPNRKLAMLANQKDWGPGNGGRAVSWDDDIKAAKAMIQRVNVAVEEMRNSLADEVLAHLLHHVAAEVVEAAQARRAEGGLEFHDLLVLAREMLRTNREARATLHSRYTHLLLDEFQDTDPIQIEVAMLIASSLATDIDDDVPPWSRLPVDEGRLFFVGDPKQSIYRFRRADIELFLAARNRFGPGGSWARLSTNFRTVAPILDWVNATFEQLMPEEIEGKQPRYEPLVAFRQADSGADHRPILLGGPHGKVGGRKPKAGELRELEAVDVARVVTDIVEHPDAWPVHDEATGSWRAAALGDVTILLPTRTSLPYLRAALDDAHLPYRIATGTLVYDTQEVRDALAAVRAIDDPSDHLSLVATLRSPLYGCSDVDLFTYHDAGGRWDLRRQPPSGLPADHPVCESLAHLRSLWEQRWWITPSTLLDRLLRERRAALLAFGEERPADVWRRLRFLVDQARSFEEAGGGDLRTFTEWAELQGADLARVHEPLLPETDEDALRILTIHGSKGLEFPITILSGMTTQPNGRRQGVSVLWDDDSTPAVKLRGHAATANHEPRASLESEMDEHEKIRLAYVAATRARDHLVVSCHHLDGVATSYGGIFHEASESSPLLFRRLESQAVQLSLLSEPSERRREAGPADAGPPLTGRGEDRAGWIERRTALIEANAEPRVISATGVARASIEVERSVDPLDELVDEDDDGADQPTDGALTPRRRGRAGTSIGSAVHAVLQFLDFGQLSSDGPIEIDTLVRQQCTVEAIPDHVNVVAAMVRSALGSDALSMAAAFPHHKEVFVAAPVGNRVIEGYVDLLIEGPGGLIVVDYKTDSVRSDDDVDAKLASYELQAASYAVALEEVVGQSVAECRFVFCRPSGAIERTVRDLDGAKRRVRAVLEAGTTGR